MGGDRAQHPVSPPEKKKGTQTTQKQILKFLALSNIAPLTLSAIAAQ